MGYDSIDEIGLHSIRKGVSSYLASLPGGPPPAALCLRGGWSMGQVKDIYFHQTQGGDEFAGRCASMLNLMNGEFATSPAYFKSTVDESDKKKDIEYHDSQVHWNGLIRSMGPFSRLLTSIRLSMDDETGELIQSTEGQPLEAWASSCAEMEQIGPAVAKRVTTGTFEK